VVFIDPRTNAKLVLKIHVALCPYHAANLPQSTSNFKHFRQNAAVSTPPKCRHTAAQQSQTKLILFPFCTSQQSAGHHAAAFTSKRFTLSIAYLYQKDERALTVNLQNIKLL
jgi:hypothetical protein